MVSGGMNSQIETVFAEDPPAVVLGELEISTLRGEVLRDAARLLDEEHYLGAGRPVGRTLVQAVHHHDRWVAHPQPQRQPDAAGQRHGAGL